MNIPQFRKAAESIAIAAGKIILNYRGKANIVQTKSDLQDVATEADHASEKYILSELKKLFPRHTYLAEESGSGKKNSSYRWIIDPLDGTKDFLRGMSSFCVNLALEYKNKIIVGVVYFPVSGELYSCGFGIGSTLSGKRLKVSDRSTLGESFVVAHPPRNNLSKKQFDHFWDKLISLSRTTYRFRAISHDVLSLCWVALGAYEGFYLPYPYPKWWDIAPGILMVKEAGGEITTVTGKDLTQENYKEGFVASNGKTHKQLIKLLQNITND